LSAPIFFLPSLNTESKTHKESFWSGKTSQKTFHHFKLNEYALKFFLQLARQTMMNISSQISHLVLVLIAINVVYNEARQITSRTTSVATENVNSNDEKLLKSSEVNAKVLNDESPSTAIVATQQEAREDKYSYFYVGRWTWHIPLWFTLWFSFYVFFNVIRSIYGHTVS
jgi:hypothetical protein